MSKNYIDNDKFEKLIFQYQKSTKEVEEELFNLFDLLITNIFNSFGFSVDEDDAKQECFVLILKTLPGFDSSKGSAFNYFTTIILNNLKLVYTKDKKYKDKIEAYTNYLLQKEDPSTQENNK